MSQLNFAINIGAVDQTAAGVNSAMNNFRRLTSSIARLPLSIAGGLGKFLTGGLGLPGINMGLRPLIAGLDNIIDRGAALDVTRKSFASLTGLGQKTADALARSLVESSNGTLRQAKAMEIANRAMVAGIDVWRDLPTIMDFASKKALTTGVSFELAIDQLVTGLSRGSPAFLDNFGLLIDGIDGVKRAFDTVSGRGAFDALSPAQQKAELIRQAMADIRTQSERIGVTGKETAFVWAQITSSVGDAVDKMFAAISRNKALTGALTGMRDFLGGMTQHFEGGGTLGELLSGKGQSGGILGLAGGALLDVGEALGRGILGGILKALSKIPEFFDAIWEGGKALVRLAVEEIGPAIRSAFAWLKTDFLPALKVSIREALVGDKGAVGLMSRLITWIGGVKDGTANWFGRLLGLDVNANLNQIIRQYQRSQQMSPEFDAARRRALDETRRERATIFGDFSSAAPAGRADLGILRAVGAAMMATTASRSIWQVLGGAGDSLLGGGVLGGRSRFMRAFGEFRDEFRFDRAGEPGRVQPVPGGMQLTRHGVRRAENELRLVDREIRRVSGQSDRAAAIAAAAEIRNLRRQGFDVTREDEARIRGEFRDRFRDERTAGLRERRGEIQGRLDRQADVLGVNQRIRAVDEIMKIPVEIQKSNGEMINRFDAMLDWMRKAVDAFIGGETQLAQAQT